jgi:ankyrin repeat protein
MSLLEELFEAVSRGDSKRVEELLGMGVNPNARAEGRFVVVAGRAQESVLECRNCTPLHVAAYAGHARIVKLLIKHGGDVNTKDDLGLTPLHYAAYGRNAKVIQVLLNSGADPLALDAYCRTPLDLLGFGRNPERLGSLLKSILASAFRSKPERELFKAVAEGDPRKVREALARGANPNTWTGTGATPLHYAAFLGHAGVVKVLLEGGTHVDPRDRDGRTPLHYAVAGGHAEVVDLLLSYGANPFTRDRWGLTPLDLAEILSGEEEAGASGTAGASREAHAKAPIWRTCDKCSFYLRRSGYCALLGMKVMNPSAPPCQAPSEGALAEPVEQLKVADAGSFETIKSLALSRDCSKCPYYLRRSEYCAILGVKVADPATPPCATASVHTLTEKSDEKEHAEQFRMGTQVRLSAHSMLPVSAGNSLRDTRCPRCGSKLVYLKSLGKYYCFNCKSYAP